METDKIELTHCPFCGGEAFTQAPNMHNETCTVCKNCGIYAAWGTPKEAIAAWNRRTPSDHIVDVNKKVDEQSQNGLRPCLRCGGAVTLKRKFISEGVVGCYITCEKCEEMTNVFKDERALRDEWNLVRHESAYSMPDNMPLTTKELFGMDGKPVYLVFGTIEDGGLSEQWDLVDVDENDRTVNLVNSVGNKLTFQFDEEISGMRVYRRRPEDKKNEQDD